MNLIFNSKGSELAIPLGDVREVVRSPRLTPLPFVPSHILGIFSLRGTLVTVLDAAQEEAGLEKAVVVLNKPPYQVGILVDKVIEVREKLNNAGMFNVQEVLTEWNASV